MSEIKPTPGPWYVLGDDELSGIKFIEISRGDFGPEYRSIAWVGNQPDGISDEDRANANVMAASWEMLEALRECQSALAMMIAPEAIKQTTVVNAFASATAAEAKARAVIAKAEGRL